MQMEKVPESVFLNKCHATQERQNASQRTRLFSTSGTAKARAAAAAAAASGKQIIDLTSGEIWAELSPAIRDGAITAINRGVNRYTDTVGLIELRNAIDPLSALVGSHAISSNETGKTQFDVLWTSGFAHATALGLPDSELAILERRIDTIASVAAVTAKPILADGDTGGDAVAFLCLCRRLEQMGVSGVVVEDKTGAKRTSLASDVRHELEDRDIFVQKIAHAKAGLQSDDFLIFARIESLIAGTGLRCELGSQHLLEHLRCAGERKAPRLISLMEHVPGQGQWLDAAQFREHYARRYNLGEPALAALIERRKADQAEFSATNRATVIERAREYGCLLASHDDAVRADVERARQSNCTIAEFPTSLEAAHEARRCGMHVIAGAPNLVRGGSHSGNVAASTLASEGLVDILSSDYCPSSLLHAVFCLAKIMGIPMHVAAATACMNPARVLNLHDRGSIEEGKRADLVRVRDTPQGPVVVAAWCSGRQVA